MTYLPSQNSNLSSANQLTLTSRKGSSFIIIQFTESTCSSGPECFHKKNTAPSFGNYTSTATRSFCYSSHTLQDPSPNYRPAQLDFSLTLQRVGDLALLTQLPSTQKRLPIGEFSLPVKLCLILLDKGLKKPRHHIGHHLF